MKIREQLEPDTLSRLVLFAFFLFLGLKFFLYPHRKRKKKEDRIKEEINKK